MILGHLIMTLLSRLWNFSMMQIQKRSYPAAFWASLDWNAGLCRGFTWSIFYGLLMLFNFFIVNDYLGQTTLYYI